MSDRADGYYTFRISYKGSYNTEEIHAVEIRYTFTHVVFCDHIGDTLVAIRADMVDYVRRLPLV